MAATPASRAVDEIFQLFGRHGNGTYNGEAVSQLEHALQAAKLARAANFGAEAVAAALLHDCGHMRGLEDPTTGRMAHCGVMDHELLGGAWLRRLGFSGEVATLVARHVDAKRYLCRTQPGYHSRLSETSKTTLTFQGGPMNVEEAAAFEQDELFKTIIAMRHWDEAAKVPGKRVPDLESYRSLLEAQVVTP